VKRITIELARDLADPRGEPGWHWCILIDKHAHRVSDSFQNLSEATNDFKLRGVPRVAELEERLKARGEKP
jgi:hypothetical protein